MFNDIISYMDKKIQPDESYKLYDSLSKLEDVNIVLDNRHNKINLRDRVIIYKDETD